MKDVEPCDPQLRWHDANYGEMLLLYEWGTPREPWLFVRGPGNEGWVSLRRATADDLALLHGLVDTRFERNP